MQLYGLKLAQPSLCSSFESQTWQGPLFKDSRTVLHYTTFVEIMVPMFEMQFFVTKVVRTLEHAETGEAPDVLLLLMQCMWIFLRLVSCNMRRHHQHTCAVHTAQTLVPSLGWPSCTKKMLHASSMKSLIWVSLTVQYMPACHVLRMFILVQNGGASLLLLSVYLLHMTKWQPPMVKESTLDHVSAM